MTSVAEFNAMMKDAGNEIRLIRSSEGALVLENEGRATAGIPECSEDRAVWCAYYNLKGRDVRVRST